MSEVRRRNVMLRNPVFRRLWTARAISFIGDGIAITALVLHVGSTNGTGTAVGALLLAQALPHLAGPMAGVIADRTDQRRLMIACNVGNTVVFAVAAWLLPGLLGLIVLVATSSILDTIFGPAGRSAIPALVDEDDLLPANAWLGTALNMQVAIGPLLGGLFVATLGIRGALVADAASFLLSAALLLRVPPLPPHRAGSERTSFLADTWAGLAYVRRHAVARAVVITLFLGVAFAGIDNVALVFLSREVLGAGAIGFGVVAAAFGIGMLAASIALSGGRSRSPRALFLGGWLLTAAGTLLTGLAPAVWLAVTAQAIGGAGNGADNVASDTLVQRSVPRAMLGRVFGATSMAAYVGAGIAYAAGGPLLDATSPRFVFLVAGVGVLGRRGAGAHPPAEGSLTRRRPGRRPGLRGPIKRGTEGLLLGGDLEGEHRLDLREQMDPDLVRSEGADGLLQVHVLAIHLDVGLRGDRLGDVGGRDGSEELALLAGTCGDQHLGARSAWQRAPRTRPSPWTDGRRARA